MPIHKKPIDSLPSKLVAKYAQEIAFNSNGTILDAPCGYGRNAAYIASFGSPVLCVDNNDDALTFITSGVNLTTAQLENRNLLRTLRLDLLDDPWPFKEESLGAIINVHFFNPTLIELFLRSLKIGGYLLVETIHGRGGNYHALPEKGFMKEKLAGAFEIKYLQEKKVGPLHTNAVTAKLLAIKHLHLPQS